MKISSNRKSTDILTSANKELAQRETRKILRKLTEAEKKCLELFRRTSDAVIMLDRSWRFKYLNRQAGILLQRKPEDLIGKIAWDEFPKAVLTRRIFQKAMKDQRITTYTDYYEQIDVWAESNIYPAKDGLTIFIQNITEKKKLELKLVAATLRAREKERNAIGEELHDNVNQILVSTRLILSMVNKQANCDHQLVETCIQQLQSAIEENRRISRDLVTPDFETETLLKKIHLLVQQMLEKSGVKVNIRSNFFDEGLLSDEQRLCIYRIAQEQSCNILRYARAKTVNISIATTIEHLVMHITDDGVGVNKTHTPGIGIRNMKSRLAVFNGTLHTYSSPGKGFSLEVMIPLRNPNTLLP